MSKFFFRPKKSGENPNPGYRPPVGFSANVGTVTKEKYDELKDKYDRLLENAGYMAEALKNYEAVEVVRCKDCKHYGCEQEPSHGTVYHFCKRHKGLVVVRRDTYCSYGERKNES